MKVLVREQIAEAGVALLRERGHEVDVDESSDLAGIIGGYDVSEMGSRTR